MKEILLHAKIKDDGKLSFLIKHRGFYEEGQEGTDHVMAIVAILEAAKQQAIKELDLINNLKEEDKK